MKNCPNCRASHWEGAAECECGYSFESGALSDGPQKIARNKWLWISVGVVVLVAMALPGVREKRRDIAKQEIIPRTLKSAYPPVGECRDIKVDGRSMYLYHSNGEQRASRRQPEDLVCYSEGELVQRAEVRQAKIDPSSLTTEFVESELRNSSNNANKNLPVMVDKNTRWDATAAGPGRRFTYQYTLVSLSSSAISEEELHAQAADRIRNGVCTSKDMDLWISNGVTVIYRFRGNDGGVIGDIVIEGSSCSA